MKPVNINKIEDQKITSQQEVTGSDAEELLRKYGYSQDNVEYNGTNQNNNNVNNNNLTFEEMIKKQQEEEKRRLEEKYNKEMAPKPITFDGERGYNSRSKYGSQDGLNFKINISSDMDLPK